jgi:ABC-type antimicrobial peptide transport system permease subunit
MMMTVAFFCHAIICGLGIGLILSANREAEMWRGAAIMVLSAIGLVAHIHTLASRLKF